MDKKCLVLKNVDIENGLPRNFKTDAIKKKNGFWRLSNVRLYLGLLLCFNFLALAQMRNGLSMAMVCMVNNTALKLRENSSFFAVHPQTDEDEDLFQTNLTLSKNCYARHNRRNDYEGEFVWDAAQQGILHSALYWGSLTSLPAGYLSDRYSPRHLLLMCTLLNVVACMLTPVAATYGGFMGMAIIRIMMGAGQGMEKPVVSAFTATWIPTDERSTVISLYTAGNQLSSIIGMPLNALMCKARHLAGGWPLIFYVSGVLGLIWCILWSIGVTNKPESHKRISEQERDYILNSLKSQNLQARKEAAKHVPWKALLLSPAVISCSLCSFANGFTVSTAGSYIPTYYMQVLGLDLKKNGLYSSLPYICQLLFKFAFAAISDDLVRRGCWKVTPMSKVFNSIASFGTAGFFFACGYLSCAQTGLAVACISAALGMFGAYTPGYWTSMTRIAPVYSGTIGSLTTATNTIGSILAPYLIGYLTVNGTRREWQTVFGIVAGILAVSGIFYNVFGSADIQPWAKLPEHKKSKQMEPLKPLTIRKDDQNF